MWHVNRIREKTGLKHFKNDVLSVHEFIDEILGLKGSVWPSLMTDLGKTFDGKIDEVIKLDGIGSGKTTFASLAFVYILYLLGSLKEPARVFGLMPGSKMMLMVMSLRQTQAKMLVFDDVRDIVKNNKWFRLNSMYKEKSTHFLEFPNRVFLFSGSSSETVPIGFNIIAAALDEGDWFIQQSHKGDSTDQAENVYFALKDRIETRFEHRGLLILVSSTRNPQGFMVNRHEEVKKLKTGYTTKRPQWESKPGRWAPFFLVRKSDCKVIEDELLEYRNDGEFITIPQKLREAFDRNPRRFLRDRASVLSISDKAYVLRPDVMLANVNHQMKNPVNADGTLAEWFTPRRDKLYYSHTDLGYTRDKCCLAIGYQHEMTTILELVYVINPREEGKVDFQRVRDIYYELVSRGFKFGKVTFDSFQSFDTIQALEKKGLPAELYSVDKNSEAYDAWLEANYSGEFEIVPVMDLDGKNEYMFNVQSLVLKGTKVDHLKTGEKDITDAVAATTFHCRSTIKRLVRAVTRKKIAPKADTGGRVK